MILLWGLETDPPLAALITTLHARGADFFLLDQNLIAKTELSFKGADTTVRCGATRFDLDTVTSVFLRPFSADQLPAVIGETWDDALTRHAARIGESLWAWADVTTAQVFNRPSQMESNHSKPLQLAMLEAHGFLTPETLVTNDPAAARRFCREHGEVIYKSISSQRSIVSRVTARHRERWTDLPHCPTQFQRRIEGVDVRAHVVGESVFACEINASNTADDYRYSKDGAEVRPLELPEKIASQCRAATTAAGLLYSGIDLRRTPKGAWYAFEINPAPAFTYFGKTHAHQVAQALVDLLETKIHSSVVAGVTRPGVRDLPNI